MRKTLHELMIECLPQWEATIERMMDEIKAAGVDGTPDNDSRTIVHDNKNIYLYFKSSDIFEYATYSPDLYLFLVNTHLCSYRYNENRIQVELMYFTNDSEASRFTPLLGRFLHYYYHSGLAAEQFMMKAPEKLTERRKAGYQIDHANNDKHNHCRWNLSEIPAKANGMGEKGTLVAQIKPPYYCYPIVSEGGEYRVVCGWVQPYAMTAAGVLEGQKMLVKCKDIADLISFLKSFVRHCKKFPKPVSEYYFSGQFENASMIAEYALDMDEDKFFEWKSGSDIVSVPLI